MRLLWHENGWDDYMWWQAQDKKTIKFHKKTQKTPRAQIELAKKYRADFLKRQQAETRKGRR